MNAEEEKIIWKFIEYNQKLVELENEAVEGLLKLRDSHQNLLNHLKKKYGARKTIQKRNEGRVAFVKLKLPSGRRHYFFEVV